MLKKANKHYPVLNNGRILPTAKDWNKIIDALNNIGGDVSRIQNPANDTYVDTDLNNETVNIVAPTTISLQSPIIDIGDVSGVNGATGLRVNDTLNKIYTNADELIFAFNDWLSTLYQLRSRDVEIGDTGNYGLSTKLEVKDATRTVGIQAGNFRAIANTIFSNTSSTLGFSNITIGDDNNRGNDTKISLNDSTRTVAVSANALTLDANTVSLGSGELVIVDTSNFKVTIDVSLLPTYADDAAAGTGGLATGNLYKTATGDLKVKL